MRSKATGAKLNPNGATRAREKTQLVGVKKTRRSNKTGKGLGKAGAKRLGRLLKRVIQQQEDTLRRTLSLPKTPVRLFKYLIQAEDAHKTSSAKATSPHVPQLILSVVSQYKHRGGISMVELKQALAAGGCDVTKNRRVTVITQKLVNNDTPVRTTRNATIRLNHKPETKQKRTRAEKSLRLKADVKQNETSQGAERSQRQARRTKEPKPKGKTHREAARSHKPKKTRKAAAKSHKLKSKTRKRTTVSHKLKSKTHKPAAKSHKQRKITPKSRRKLPKSARTIQRKAPMAKKRGLKKKHHPYKSSRKIWSTRLRRRFQTGKHNFKRRAYYR